MVQWLRIHLLMQGTWVQSLVGERKISHAVGQLSPGTTTRQPQAIEEKPLKTQQSQEEEEQTETLQTGNMSANTLSDSINT